MLGGIAHVGSVGGILGLGAIHALVRNEQDKVYYSTMASSLVGAGLGTGLGVLAVLGSAAAGTGGAAAVTSGLAALGCGAGMIGGIAATGGIALGVTVLFGLIAFGIWWWLGQTGKRDDAAGDDFFDSLSRKVQISVPEHSINIYHEDFLLQPAPSTSSAESSDLRLPFAEHVHRVLEKLHEEEDPADLDSMCTLGGIAVLKKARQKFLEADAEHPWYAFWHWGRGARVERAVRLLSSQFLLASCPEAQDDRNAGGRGDGAHVVALEIACDSLSEKGKQGFGTYARMLCSGLDAIAKSIYDRTNERERECALAFFDLTRTATDAQIKKAYRHLSCRFHPDKGGSEELQAYLNGAARLLLHSGRMAVYRASVLAITEQAADDVEQERSRSQDTARTLIEETTGQPTEWLPRIREACGRLRLSRQLANLQKQAFYEFQRLRGELEERQREAAEDSTQKFTSEAGCQAKADVERKFRREPEHGLVEDRREATFQAEVSPPGEGKEPPENRNGPRGIGKQWPSQYEEAAKVPRSGSEELPRTRAEDHEMPMDRKRGMILRSNDEINDAEAGSKVLFKNRRGYSPSPEREPCERGQSSRDTRGSFLAQQGGNASDSNNAQPSGLELCQFVATAAPVEPAAASEEVSPFVAEATAAPAELAAASEKMSRAVEEAIAAPTEPAAASENMSPAVEEATAAPAERAAASDVASTSAEATASPSAPAATSEDAPPAVEPGRQKKRPHTRRGGWSRRNEVRNSDVVSIPDTEDGFGDHPMTRARYRRSG